jgi:prepilin-type N-terminal cleavage/methylation domain-containing protein
MRRPSAFSLIELLVALSILAVVAAIIVPKFVGVRTAAANTVAQQNISELNDAYNRWQALGGTYAAASGADGTPCDDTFLASNMLSFLCYPGSNSADPSGNPRQQGNCANLRDTYGPGGSWTVSVNAPISPSDLAQIIGGNAGSAPTGSSPDGFYSNGSYILFKSGDSLYFVFYEPQSGTDPNYAPNGNPYAYNAGFWIPSDAEAVANGFDGNPVSTSDDIVQHWNE